MGDSIYFSQSAPVTVPYDTTVETGFQVPSEFSISEPDSLPHPPDTFTLEAFERRCLTGY